MVIIPWQSAPVLGDIFGRGTGGRGVRHVLGPDGSVAGPTGPTGGKKKKGSGAQKKPSAAALPIKKKDSTNTKQKSWKSERSSDFSKNELSYHGLPQIHNSCFNPQSFGTSSG